MSQPKLSEFQITGKKKQAPRIDYKYCINKIDEAAEKARLRYMTRGAGQVIVYMEKSEEAQDFVAAGYPNPDNYPYIKAEMEATGKSAKQCADDIISAITKWRSVSSLIEKIRISGKTKILQSTDIDGIKAISKDTVNKLDEV